MTDTYTPGTLVEFPRNASFINHNEYGIVITKEKFHAAGGKLLVAGEENLVYFRTAAGVQALPIRLPDGGAWHPKPVKKDRALEDIATLEERLKTLKEFVEPPTPQKP